MIDVLFGALGRGGPVLWLIAGLSVVTLTVILWKLWPMMRLGLWGGARSEAAVALWQAGDRDAAMATLAQARSVRASLAHAAMEALGRLPEEAAREEITRRAKRMLAEARSGLRALELIMTIAPLLGLLGTVLGMIDAFQTLQESGAQADPADLAGGIWEALLTTAAGMAVAIPAGIALSWFEAQAERLQGDLEDLAARIVLGAGHRDGAGS